MKTLQNNRENKNRVNNNLPEWCKPFTEVYRNSKGGRWHLYDIISETADGMKVRTFEGYRDRIETKTLADIISDGEKVESGEYGVEMRDLTPKMLENLNMAFDILPAGTIISSETEYLRITGYDQEHHRYMTTSMTGTGIRAEFVRTYYTIGIDFIQEHTAEDLPTWCKVGARVSRMGRDYTVSEISDGIVWLSYFGNDREGMSIDAFIWRAKREYITPAA